MKTTARKIMGLLLIAVLIAVGAAFYQTVPPARTEIFSTNYFTLREKFLSAARGSGAAVQSIPLQARGPAGQELFIDVAWLGAAQPRYMLLHISGTHGVEGYVGSAIQSAVLSRPIALPADSAVIFIHGLNAWGMAHKRRFNENNVDLNRNFLLDAKAFAGAPEGYRLVEAFLNPAGPPRRVDTFFPGVVINILRHGYNALKQAIAGGQYEYPRGIYYGGKALEESLEALRRFMLERVSGVQKLFVIEIHSGLGEWAKDVLFWPLKLSEHKSKWFMEQTGETLASDAPEEGVGFRTPGDLQNEVPKLLPATDTYWVLQEFGAYGAVKTLKTLRDENRYHHSGGKDIEHWSKQLLLEAFSPGDADWQRKVLERGTVYFDRVLAAVSNAAEAG